LSEDFSGKFIVLDGPDACGKSTQAAMLAEWIKKTHAVQVVTYRDPGTTAVGEKIRQILLDPAHEGMEVNVEALLYIAARAQLWAERISQDLSAGKCVVMDRWISSTCAYQGYAGEFGIDKVIKLCEDCLERVWPDVTVIVDVDVETACQRMNRALDRMEQKGKEYHQKVRQGFLKLADSYDKVVAIDGRDTIEAVHKTVVESVEMMLSQT
jgi:dTMP kinase